MRYIKMSFLFLFLLSSCATPVIPVKGSLDDLPAYRAVFAGKGEAYIHKDGSWRRAERFDYEFMVAERLIEGGFEAIKEIHRRHPDFPRWAGKRDMTIYFRGTVTSETPDGVEFMVDSLVGKGTGRSDPKKENTVIEIEPRHTAFAPFNTLRITQRLDHENGILRETVELFEKKKDGTEKPFIKMEEAGLIYLPKSP